MLLADFFYNGVARWQLGFDNPNKAAVLAVELILVGLALVAATRRLVLRVLGAVLTVGSLYVLLHTFSRGGMVALAVAAVPLAIVSTVFERYKDVCQGVFFGHCRGILPVVRSDGGRRTIGIWGFR